MSNVRKLFSVNAIIFASLIIGFLNNVAIGGFFGLNRVIDAYFASSILGQMFMYLIVDYVGKNFLPIYAARFHESPDDAGRLASIVVTLFTVVAAGVVVLLLLLAEPIFSFLLPGFEDADIEVTTRMFAIQAPAIVLMTINNFHQYVWQHDEKYSRVVFARLFIPLSLLFFVIGGNLIGDAYALPMGFLAGHLMSTIVLAYRLPYRFRPRIEFRNADVRKILTNSAMLTGSGLIARMRAPIMQYYASLLGEGAIAAMSLALKLCRPINQSALMGVQMIVFSRSAREVAKGKIDKLANIYDYAISAVLLGTMPIAIWITLNARQLVDVLYLRGEFTDSMAALTALALTGAAASIVFRGLVKLMSESFYAMHKIIVPIVLMPLGTIVFFFATKFLSESYGIFGLTVANSTISTLTTIVMTFCLAYYLPKFSALTIFKRMVSYLALALIAALAGVEVSTIAGLDGVLRLFVSLVVMIPLYAGALWISQEAIFRRILRSARTAIKGSDRESEAP
jgi:putative peptidoglycan lipid II flippase